MCLSFDSDFGCALDTFIGFSIAYPYCVYSVSALTFLLISYGAQRALVVRSSHLAYGLLVSVVFDP